MSYPTGLPFRVLPAYLCPEVIEQVIEPESTELFITVEVCVHCGALVSDRGQHDCWHEPS